MGFESTLKILEDHYKGVLLLLVVVFSIIYIINWLARIFNWGRYKQTDGANTWVNRNSIIADFFVRLVTDFRHLFALAIFLFFVSLIFYAMGMSDKFDEKMDALQMIIASLGGLLGSIIGYYFGESAVRRAQIPSNSQTTSEGNLPETEPIVEPPVAKGIPKT